MPEQKEAEQLNVKATEVYNQIRPLLFSGLPAGVIRQICNQLILDVDSIPVNFKPGEESQSLENKKEK